MGPNRRSFVLGLLMIDIAFAGRAQSGFKVRRFRKAGVSIKIIGHATLDLRFTA